MKLSEVPAGHVFTFVTPEGSDHRPPQFLKVRNARYNAVNIANWVGGTVADTAEVVVVGKFALDSNIGVTTVKVAIPEQINGAQKKPTALPTKEELRIRRAQKATRKARN